MEIYPSPNLIPRFNKDYNYNDFIYGVKSIFKQEMVDSMELSSTFGDKDFFFTNTGRTSLYTILRALNFPKGSMIGVPLYSCTVVFDAIIKSGYTPYFIDIDLNNYTLDTEDLAEKVTNLSAVIVIHTFGRPAEMDRIREIAGDVPVIEDCAHSLLSKYKGEQTGTLGVASFFSPTKYLSNGGGGMIILNNTDLVDGFKTEMDLLNSFTIITEIRDSFVIYLHSILYHKPLFGLFAHPLGSYLRSITSRDNGVGDFTTNKIRKSDRSLLFNKLYGFETKVELQRANSLFLIRELKDTSLILPHEKKNTYCNYYLFPILFENNDERDVACKHLRKNGVDTAKLYNMTPLAARQFYGYQGDCPNTEELVDEILTIPNYYSLTDKELLHVVIAVKEVVGLS
ncbi:MAG: UDP-4-amino-4-deoxy-L-arabinose--oxoglutarate aminotransferase [Candidatus Methanogaster sp.]|nr:MAG: UDP-4-amino-4-deoxy-L-arabinose--oxoglutarate aminotransferase [ANME-2 cluster archaeon]